MISKSNSIGKFEKYPVLLGPNIGKPQMLSYSDDSKDDTDFFSVELLFIADNNLSDGFIYDSLSNNINLIPITELDKKTKKGIRKSEIKGKFKSIAKAPVLSLGDPKLVSSYGFEGPRKKPLNGKLYGTKDTYYIANVEFKFKRSLKKQINKRGYVMCDLVQNFPDLDGITKINYHSVVLSTQKWEDLTIIHATDLHIAKRNDEALPYLMEKYDGTITEKALALFDFFAKKDVNLIEERLINPNNNFRMFIKLMNEFRKEKKADFAVITGDIVDFCTRSDFGHKATVFDFQNTNWSIFLNILLNNELIFRPDVKPKYIFPGEELMIPIFTVPGNHGYRCYHYSFKWGPLNRILNLRPMEVLHFRDVVPANPVSALLLSNKTMMGYNQYINPYQDFHVKFGEHLLVMLDSGYDSAKKIKELFHFDPAAVGFSEDQVEFVKNIAMNHENNKGIKIAAFHAPVLNPMPLKIMKKKIRSQFKKVGFKTMEDFKEPILSKNYEIARSDGLLNFKYGCIANNWADTLDTFNKYNFLVLNGHTHNLFECRTENTDEKSIIPSFDFGFIKTNVDVPAAIYIDDYSFKHTDSDYFTSNLSFHLQTAAMGPKPHGKDGKVGPFRKIKIKNNKLASFTVDYVSNYVDLLKLD